MNHLRRLLVGSIHVSDQRGFVAVTVALLLVGLLSVGALALDISSLFLVRNELQNAADAGALSAARQLYMADGEAINPGANAVGVAAATANTAQNVVVEVNADTSANTGDVERGHWRWTDHSFTPNDSLATVVLDNVSNAELDANPDFINAVRVRVRRQTVPARAFLSKVMGFGDFQMQAEAIAYIGFAGSFLSGEADQPIVICKEALLNAYGEYSCSTGRMINSGGDSKTYNTGGWTDFTQPCNPAAKKTVLPYIGCDPVPSPEAILQQEMGCTGGQVQSVFDAFMDCWWVAADSDADGRPDTVYNMTLPVVECPSNNVDSCAKLVGAVNVNLIWMIRQANTSYLWAPSEMTGPDPFPDWVCPDSITGGAEWTLLSEPQRRDCWFDFIDHFNLVNYEGVSISTYSPLSKIEKTMYFLPDCAVHIPIGVTAGPNLGVLAKIPILVQ